MKYDINFTIDLKKNPYPGLYIALEGIDESGKTTQVDHIAEYFENQGKKVVKTHEPRRDGAMGPLIDSILKGTVKIPAVAIQYLFAAQRATFLEELVTPALKEGAVVITDRSFWSSIPYGLLDKYESEKEENADQLLVALSILSMYHEFIAPDISFVLDVKAETAVERFKKMGRDPEIYEKKEKLEKLKEGYNFLLQKFPEEMIKINAEKGIEEVTQDILSEIKKLSK